MISNPSNPVVAAMRRRHAAERVVLQTRQNAERKSEGLEPVSSVDFNSLASHTEIWSRRHPNGTFYLTFMNGNLHLVHDENADAGGVTWAEELLDDDIDRLRYLLDEFRAWRAAQRHRST